MLGFCSSFQFTHPVWGATVHPILHLIHLLVSIHAPRVGCDDRRSQIIRANNKFQFTHPVWGATVRLLDDAHTLEVSIHAPRVGCDYSARQSLRCQMGFNSRTPCGVRLNRMIKNDEAAKQFQFTHPVWGATVVRTSDDPDDDVSIHAPRVGCDKSVSSLVCVSSVSIHAPRVGCD